MVSQEFPLVGQLSVGENLLLGRRPEDARRGVVDWRRLHRQAQAVLDELGLTIRSRHRGDSLRFVFPANSVTVLRLTGR